MNRRCPKRTPVAFLLLCSLLLTALVGCGQDAQQEGSLKADDVLTQKIISEDRIPVTVLVKYAFTINAFEKAAEEKFPQLDIIQVGNYTADRGIAEYERRLEHDDLADIVMTWPLDVGAEYWNDRLIDLSGMSFTSKYNNSMLNTIAKDGELYYLPGPAQVRGIVYNKTLFAERGWQVPKDYNEFIQLCQTIEQSGMRSLQLGFKNSEVLDTAFVGYSYGNCFSKPSDAEWMTQYNSGNGSIVDHFGTALDTFQNMIDLGIWKKEDLNVDYSQREKMLFTRQCAMAEDSVLMARMGYDQTGCTDEFALMPFFNPGDSQEQWARLYMVCYIGLNKHLTEPANTKKYDLVKELMEYISTTEGQAALMADTGAMYSSLQDATPPDVPEIQELRAVLSRGHYAIFPELKNAQDALRKGLAEMVAGTATMEDVIQMTDAENQKTRQSSETQPIGEATADFTLIETGNFITDAMREETGADIALFMDNGKDGLYNGKGISGKIYKGSVTEADVDCIMPDLKYGDNGELVTVTMSGQELRAALEYAIPVENGKVGWFYYFSGLKLSFAPTAETGDRVRELCLSDGSALEPKKQYTVAIMQGSVLDKLIHEETECGITIKDLVLNTVKEKGTISPSGDGRFTIVSNTPKK